VKLPVALLLLLLISVSGTLFSELAVFTDGRVLRIKDAVADGPVIRMELIGGGFLEVSVFRIDRIVDDEIDHSGDDDLPGKITCPTRYSSAVLPDGTPFAAEIQAAAKKADIDPRLLAALVGAESNFDPNAVSRAGATGLTQLMPSAAADVGVGDLFDPEENLEGGARYLRMLLDRFDDLELALAAYNAGSSTVESYNGVPPFRETKTYLRRVLGTFCPQTLKQD